MTEEPRLPDPEFKVGDPVRVILNQRNTTAWTGTIERVIWHFKDQRYNYYIAANGKSVSKRYLAVDLESVR